MDVPRVHTLTTTYSQLSEEQQARILCRLSLQLTIDARNAYRSDALDEQQSFRILKIFNELQHLIVSQLLNLLNHNTERYPDDAFIEIMAERGGRFSELLMRDLDQAIHSTVL